MIIYYSKNADHNNSEAIYNALRSKNIDIFYCDISKLLDDIIYWGLLSKIFSRVLNIIPKFSLFYKIKSYRATHVIIVHLFFINILDLIFLRLFFKKTKIVHLTLDSIHAKKWDFFFRDKLKFFDLILHTKEQDIPFYNTFNLEQVLFKQGYCEDLIKGFRNVKLQKEIDCCFIGNYAPERVKYLNFILNDPRLFKVSFFVSGKGMVHSIKSLSKMHNFKGPTTGKKYYEMLMKSRVNLIFFNELAQDKVTTRFYELLEVDSVILCQYNEYTMNLFDRVQLFKNPGELIINLKYILNVDCDTYNQLVNKQRILKSKLLSSSWDICVNDIVNHLK